MIGNTKSLISFFPKNHIAKLIKLCAKDKETSVSRFITDIVTKHLSNIGEIPCDATPNNKCAEDNNLYLSVDFEFRLQDFCLFSFFFIISCGFLKFLLRKDHLRSSLLTA